MIPLNPFLIQFHLLYFLVYLYRILFVISKSRNDSSTQPASISILIPLLFLDLNLHNVQLYVIAYLYFFFVFLFTTIFVTLIVYYPAWQTMLCLLEDCKARHI